MDWNGDHPHTNYRPLFLALRAAGFYVEVCCCHLTPCVLRTLALDPTEALARLQLLSPSPSPSLNGAESARLALTRCSAPTFRASTPLSTARCC